MNHPKIIRESFEITEKIGEGTFGDVFKAIPIERYHQIEQLSPERQEEEKKIPSNYVAIKKIKQTMDDEGIPAVAVREIGVLRKLRHQNVVQLQRVIDSENRLYLVFEYFERDLKRYIEQISPDPLDGPLARSYLLQLLCGISFCHDKRVIHRDIKPQNLLIDSQGIIKIADFGLARAFSLPMRPYSPDVVTQWYRAPELLLGEQLYTTAVDMWSLGAVGVEMFTGQPVFTGESPMDTMYRIFDALGSPNNDTWPGVEALPNFPRASRRKPHRTISQHVQGLDPADAELLDRMLTVNPKERITAREAIRSGTFDSLNG
eukprot:TRINITY_DN10316_c0_g1_i3.p1 TRINITY_DN10316_c0_g1~~TRINITY_DN10316_c0_g1_i3.p1  ORF type:complete len:318 (+),score=79.19 TRINITY_DN10316_c0_g1_i3:159-1112(+)